MIYTCWRICQIYRSFLEIIKEKYYKKGKRKPKLYNFGYCGLNKLQSERNYLSKMYNHTGIGNLLEELASFLWDIVRFSPL